MPPAVVLPYADLLDGPSNSRRGLAAVIRESGAAIVKIDSPGKDFDVSKRILALGVGDAQTVGFDFATREQIHSTPFNKGQILWPKQWFAGYCTLLGEIERQLQNALPHMLIGAPGDIAIFFDKPRCHALLARHGVRVPRALRGDSPITSHADLIARMHEARMPRVFVKLAHGSSGSGVVAFQMHGQQQRATTTVELERVGDDVRLFNSRRIVTYTDGAEIKILIDRLCRHGVHVEEWVPKAGINGRVFDLRVLGIAGEPRHVVVRSSLTPITNLHLLNQRDDPGAVRARLGQARWSELMATCTQTLSLFPDSFCVGIDVAIHSDWRGHSILELNAFGDHLNDVTDRGEDPYGAQIRAALSTQGART
jgi:hypothetical protein